MKQTNNHIGPNVKKLIAQTVAAEAVDQNTTVPDVLKIIQNPKDIIERARRAATKVQEYVNLVRTASEPNPYKNCTDEEIAGVILDMVKKKSISSLENQPGVSGPQSDLM